MQKLSDRKRGDNLKKIICVVAGVILVILIYGCSRNKQEAKEKKILLRWSGYAYPVYDNFRFSESKKFEQDNPGIMVKYEPITGDFNTKILTQMASNTAPDLFFVPDLNQFISKRVLVDLTDWYIKDKDYFKDICPQLMDAHLWNGKLYALPGNCSVNILYYNKKLFDDKKLPYPDDTWTWENFLEAAKKLTIKNERGKVVQYGCIAAFNWPSFILQNGGKIWNKDKTKCIINNPEAVEALTFWKDLYAKYKVCPTPSEIREQGQKELFIMGKAAMYWGDSWEVATFKIKGSTPLNWDAVIIPRAKGKERWIGLDYTSLGIWTGSKHRELAYELAKNMIKPERIKFLIKVGDSLPIRSSGEEVDYFLNLTDRPERAKKEMLKSLQFAKSSYRTGINPFIPSMEQGQIISENIDKFAIVGNISAEEALSIIQDKLNKLLAKNP